MDRKHFGLKFSDKCNWITESLCELNLYRDSSWCVRFCRGRSGRRNGLPQYRRGGRVWQRQEEQQEERDLPQSGHKHHESVALPASGGERGFWQLELVKVKLFTRGKHWICTIIKTILQSGNKAKACASPCWRIITDREDLACGKKSQTRTDRWGRGVVVVGGAECIMEVN